jgi:hypothetical protein
VRFLLSSNVGRCHRRPDELYTLNQEGEAVTVTLRKTLKSGINVITRRSLEVVSYAKEVQLMGWMMDIKKINHTNCVT